MIDYLRIMLIADHSGNCPRQSHHLNNGVLVMSVIAHAMITLMITREIALVDHITFFFVLRHYHVSVQSNYFLLRVQLLIYYFITKQNWLQGFSSMCISVMYRSVRNVSTYFRWLTRQGDDIYLIYPWDF